MVLASVVCLGLGAYLSKAPEIYTPGTYEAAAQGYGGDVKVTITVDASSITDVQIEGADETPGIGAAAIEELPAVIKTANGGMFDGKTGATITSDAIKAAVADCVAQARLKG